jgi:hypothetical protein
MRDRYRIAVIPAGRDYNQRNPQHHEND